jgi:hypothetical protein
MNLGGYAFAKRFSRLINNLLFLRTTHLANYAINIAHDHLVSWVQMSTWVFQAIKRSGHLQ